MKFYVPYEPETNILCFRYQGVDGKRSDALQQKIRFEMMKREEFHITSALINGVRYLRVTIMNKLTDENVLSSLLDEIEELAE
ncbi:MAG: L-2,4-diaminobutyrate decarboxylase [Paraglaciecola sp.]|jgi:L-2,4-diaminobutyrate decarboxylase